MGSFKATLPIPLLKPQCFNNAYAAQKGLESVKGKLAFWNSITRWI